MAFARATIEQDPRRVLEVKQVETQVLPGDRDVVRVLMGIVLIDQPNALNLVFDMPEMIQQRRDVGNWWI